MALTFLERLSRGEVLVADGATGTNYQRRGLPLGVPPEAWVFEAPENVLELHRAFVDAGADILLTNTFGGSRLRLGRSDYVDRIPELNRRAVALARQVAAARSGVFVAGSIGPTGTMMKPFGPLTFNDALETYTEQARALVQGGVDFFVIETMFDLEEAKAAVESVRRVADLPVVCTFSFDRGVYTMMGVKPVEVIEALKPLGVDVIGANCGRKLEDAYRVLEEMVAAEPGIPLWIKPNAGLPRGEGGSTEYDVEPREMADHAVRFVQLGAQVVGGCCGSTPEHVRAIAEALKIASSAASS